MNLSNYLKEIQKEMKLTTFPGQNVVINFTIFVIIFTAAMAAYLGALDLGFGEIVLQGIENYKTESVVSEVASTTLELASTTIQTATTTNPNDIFTK
jgi:preprotein translocase SecE subunit